MDQEARSPRVTHLSWGRLEVEGVDAPFKDAKLFPGGARAWDWREPGTSHEPGIQPADVEELLERGATTVVLSKGVHMGGSAARAAGGILGSITGSESQTRGVSVQVGTVEAAIDLTMGIEYGRDILRTVDEVRRRISDRVQNLTGLRVAELNATISEVIFPDEGERHRRAPEEGMRTEPRTLPPTRELRPGAAEREVTEVSP